jgi:hypothetical protein
MEIYFFWGIGVLIYLLIGAGVSTSSCEAEEIDSDEAYTSHKRMLWILNTLLWPYELGSVIGKASLYYGGKISSQRYFRNQPAHEITVPAILNQLAEICDVLHKNEWGCKIEKK